MSDFLSPEELAFLDRSKLNYWVGSTPPLPGFVSSLDVLDVSRDFRLEPDLHGAFDGVFFVEGDLGIVKEWRLVLDELLHLTDGTGTLVLRYSPFRYFGSHELLNAIDAWTGGHAEVLFSRRWSGDGSKVVGLTLSAAPRTRSLESLTFGLVADGRFPDRVSRFVDSVLQLEGIDEIDWEVLVCGPAGTIDHIDAQLGRTRLIEQDHRFGDLGWITNKKNRLVDAAAGDTIVLAHDRYSFAPGFLRGLKQFGADFDVLVPAQRTIDGFRYPSRVATTGFWDITSVGELQVGDYTPSMYINGGIMVASTEVLRRTRFNELLFWAEAEDVELSRRLLGAGVVARFSESVVAITDLTRGDQVSVFERLPFTEEYAVPDLDGPQYLVGDTVVFDSATTATHTADRGVLLPQFWQATDRGLLWNGTQPPEVSIRPRQPTGLDDRRWFVTLGVGGAPGSTSWAELWVNGRRAPLERTERQSGTTLLTFRVPEDLVAERHSFNLQLLGGMPEGAALRSLTLGLDLPASAYTSRFELGSAAEHTLLELDGWGHAEPWGRWSATRHCSVAVPVSSDGRHDLRISAELHPYLPQATHEQRVVVSAAGVPLDIWVFETGAVVTRSVTVSARSLTRGWLTLDFEVAWPTAPRDEFGEGDARTLGIALHHIDVRETRTLSV